MSDQFTEVTTKGWGSRIMDSIKGVLIGLLMFIVSFGVLYWNEGRVNIALIAKTATEIESISNPPAELEQKLISSTGVFQSTEKIGDFFLKEGDYIAIERNVEMYAWEEETHTKSEKNVGGSETTETTYTYKKEWTSIPASSSNFKKPDGHQNPTMAISRNSVKVKKVKLGVYNVDMGQITLPKYKTLQLNNSNVILNEDFQLASDEYLFKGKGTLNNAEIGDTRISYSTIYNPLDTATIFGKLDAKNKKISPYYGTKNTKLYRVFEGTRDTAIVTMQTEYSVLTWILRAVGFLLMWFGLMALFGPISVFLDVLPIFGTIGRVGIGIMTFIVSVVLSVITIIVSMIIHSLIALLVVIGGVIIATIWYLKNKRKKQLVKSKE